MTSRAAILPTGAYIIRNRKTSTVLHTQYSDAGQQDTSVQVYQQDESKFKDQQIWWIEPLAHYNGRGSGTGVVYSITSPGSGKSLHGDPESGWVFANQNRGEPWQRWTLRQVIGRDTREVWYNIINLVNGKGLDLDGDNPSPRSWVKVQKSTAERLQSHWEFVIPVLAIPHGWFHIQNVQTKEMLSHDYDHNPPVLLPAHESPIEPQYRRQWQFQWTLSHSKCFKSGTASEPNSWYIINRLTRIPLSPLFGNMGEKDFAGRDKNLAWKLEFDPSGNWKITNRTTCCLLEQLSMVRSGGNAVGCSNRIFIPTPGHQSWILSGPLLVSENNDIPPPTYTATAT